MRRIFYGIARAREVGKEVQHLMTSAGLLYWPFAKYMVSGADAGAFLDSLVASRIPKPGKVTGDRVGTQRGIHCAVDARARKKPHQSVAKGGYFFQKVPDVAVFRAPSLQ